VRGMSRRALLLQSSLLALCAAKLQVPTASPLTGGHEPPRLHGRKVILDSHNEPTVGGTYGWTSQMSSSRGQEAVYTSAADQGIFRGFSPGDQVAFLMADQGVLGK
jgi:hypothetical protein